MEQGEQSKGTRFLPPRVILDDGTELRLVPRGRTKRPLYVSRNGACYSLYSRFFKPIRARIISNPRHPKPGAKTHKAYQLYRPYNDILVHHAVLEAWVGPRPEGMECDHINGDSLDNRLENLEWVTHQENMRRRRELYHSRGLGFNGKKLKEGKRRKQVDS